MNVYLRVADVDGATLWNMAEEHAWGLAKSLADDGWGPAIIGLDGRVVARWSYSESWNREVVPIEWLRARAARRI